MTENKERASEFIGYEYKEITVATSQAPMYLDGYESFGWENNDKLDNTVVANKTTLHLRRNRKIVNKMELTRLQRNFEADMEEIDSLEKSKSSKPQIISLSIGFLGTAFMAGSVFAVSAKPPIIWLCILLAIPAFAGWLLAPYLYKKLLKKRISIVNPLIEEEYDQIYELFEKGNELLN